MSIVAWGAGSPPDEYGFGPSARALGPAAFSRDARLRGGVGTRPDHRRPLAASRRLSVPAPQPSPRSSGAACASRGEGSSAGPRAGESRQRRRAGRDGRGCVRAAGGVTPDRSALGACSPKGCRAAAADERCERSDRFAERCIAPVSRGRAHSGRASGAAPRGSGRGRAGAGTRGRAAASGSCDASGFRAASRVRDTSRFRADSGFRDTSSICGASPRHSRGGVARGRRGRTRGGPLRRGTREGCCRPGSARNRDGSRVAIGIG